MAIFLGLAAALTYGAGDFVGGLVTRRAPLLTVVFLSQVAGTALLVSAFPFFVGGAPTGPALAWGAGSGAAGAIGVLLLYKGLAAGQMSVVAPITAVEAAAVPVLWGLLSGERPAPLALAGVALALVAVVLVAGFDPSGIKRSRGDALAPGVREALGAGLGFGLFFVLLAEAGSTELWPLAGARAASLSVLGVLLLARRHPVRAPRGTAGPIIAAGVFDVAANVLYLLSTREGLLSIVAVLTSLYPVSTVLLARIVLGERIARPQIAGLGVALGGVVLMASS